ncbi:flagellar basal-body MS-ring/collar protein FliF [Phaeovulum sp.]|uniref:flagellar basal-body MS-ring/collar protein FliF n=1 Tax=Phaeovulum sp. TaxID=2934796 RepID=UPI00356B4852
MTLDMRRRVTVGIATLVVFAAVLGLSNIASKPSMALLYARLEGTQAGDVVTALDQRGATYEVRGDAIYVESARRDELRMLLASEGLPAPGGAGYELLDSLSGFGTTSQMFDAAYWRAKEGELGRTIASSPLIRSARVHIANPTSHPFRKELHPSASVIVATAAGGLSPAQAKALKYLVSSAVTGMTPEDVSVIDTIGGLIASGEELAAVPGSESRAQELKQSVERLLEARVGYGNAVVEVSIETVTEREAITERTFDPSTRVAISTETQERSNSSTDSGQGAVTVASNLPSGAGGVGGNSQSQQSETSERVNFEVSETTREVLRSPGAIKRLSVAVLVDAVQTSAADGSTVIEPRSEEELAALHDLVASTVGYDAARGDVITLKSLPFQPIAVPDEALVPGVFSSLAVDVMSLVQLAVLAVVALVLGLFVLRPIFTRPMPARLSELPAPETPATTRPTAALSGVIDEESYVPADLPVISGFEMAMPMGTGDFGERNDAQDPVARLKRLINERQDESVEILRSWMEDHGEQA